MFKKSRIDIDCFLFLQTEKEKVLPFYQSDEVQMEEIPDIYIEKIEGMKKAKYNEF